ncbi:hypothetical protein Hdeb2414_s0012g00387141 [Helianthus debilis subsp. tardiflorus]
MSQIFQAFPPLQIFPLHSFNPISFDFILFPKLSSPVQISGRYQKTFVTLTQTETSFVPIRCLRRLIAGHVRRRSEP